MKKNLEKYNKIMMAVLKITEEELPGLKYHGIKEWDSIAHMQIVTELEEAFDIAMDTLDILSYNTYEKGKEVLGKYGVEL